HRRAHRGLAVVHRTRREAADGHLGRHDARRVRGDTGRAMALDISRHRDPDAGAGPQHGRRRVARRDRSETVRLMTAPILSVSGLKKYFTVVKGFPKPVKTVVRAVDGVDFSIAPGEAFGLVGESGCGKSTAARALLRLIEPDAGEVRFAGADVMQARGR